MHLGMYHFRRGKGPARARLPIARHTIDLLAMLQEKTRGNVSMEEQRLVENALTELRFRFVQAMENQEKKAVPEPAAEPKKEEQAELIVDGRGVLRITVLGSGTSVGVPMIGCHCAVCTPRSARQPAAAVDPVGYGGRGVLIDTTPDFRHQALRAQIERVDAILFTHSHADQ